MIGPFAKGYFFLRGGEKIQLWLVRRLIAALIQHPVCIGAV